MQELREAVRGQGEDHRDKFRLRLGLRELRESDLPFGCMTSIGVCDFHHIPSILEARVRVTPDHQSLRIAGDPEYSELVGMHLLPGTAASAERRGRS